MTFEWDPAKNLSNIQKHGFDFSDAEELFRGLLVVDPDILVGKPVVNGTRLSVDFLLGLLGQGWPEAEILRNFPGLQREDLLACWAYASGVLREEKVYRYEVA